MSSNSPAGLGAIDKGRPDYTVYCGDWAVGRIYETQAVPTICVGSVTDRQRPHDTLDRVATLEEAKTQFWKNWDAWKAWAELQEMPLNKS